MKKIIPFILLIFLACSQGGDEKSMNQVAENIKLNPADIKKLASKKIYFGHMSVGYNIIDGLKAILPANSGLNIIENSDPKDFSKPVFAHSQIGENCKPEMKIANFVKKMDAGLGNKADIAFFKFCYVDVVATTDVVKLFDEYKIAMDGLVKKYPKTSFIHITVPVTTEDQSFKRKLKDYIKAIIGRQVSDHIADNIKRMEFNKLIRKEYKTSVFDLAEIESTDDAPNVTLSRNGNLSHNVLQKKYTFDDGHLNIDGGKKVASQLIITLDKFAK